MPAVIWRPDWFEIGVAMVLLVVILVVLVADEVRRQKRREEWLRWQQHANRYHDRPHD